MFLSSPLTSLLLALPFLAHASASPISTRTDALQWTTDWPERWCAGTEYELTWTGGSGIYELAGWINYPGLPDTHPGTFFRDSTQTSYNWTAFNPGSGTGNTFTFSIIDPENVDSSSSAWFSIGPELPLVVC